MVEGYRKAQIPLDAMWTDIDYMDGFRVFTLNPRKFAAKEMRVCLSLWPLTQSVRV